MTTLMNPSRETQEQRQQLLQQVECQLVGADEFCEMLISNRKLVRFDQPAALLRGLFDPQAGVRFIVEEEKLRDHRALR